MIDNNFRIGWRCSSVVCLHWNEEQGEEERGGTGEEGIEQRGRVRIREGADEQCW
jgi:hypothetical protein